MFPAHLGIPVGYFLYLQVRLCALAPSAHCGIYTSLALAADAVAGDFGERRDAAHGHGVFEFGTDLVDVRLDAFAGTAVDGCDEGAGDDDGVGALSLIHI